MSQGKEGKQEDGVSLDVHAITQLQNENVPPTDDSHKYKYKAKSENKETEYGEFYLQGRRELGVPISSHLLLNYFPVITFFFESDL